MSSHPYYHSRGPAPGGGGGEQRKSTGGVPTAHAGSSRPRPRVATNPAMGTAADSSNSSSAHPHQERRDSFSAQTRRQSSAGISSERRTERHQIRETLTVKRTSPLKHEGKSSSRRAEADSEKQRKTSAAATDGGQRARKNSEEPDAPWLPQASLISHTTAPLATRVSAPPLATSAPHSLAPQPLNQLSLEAQEAAIIEDLLFVFMGFEGQYICYVETYNPSEEKDRLLGPQFRIRPGLDPSLRDLTTAMLKMATHYTAIEAFVEVIGREEYGAVNHALCSAIRKLLKDYLILIAQLEHQMLTNETFTLHLLNLHTKPTSHMLSHIYNMAIEVLKANSILEDDTDEESSDDSDKLEDILESLRDGGNIGQSALRGKKICKGGSVLGLITKRLASMSGDPAARTLLTTLLREASRPYMTMLNEWLHHGGIRDPHAEFVVKEQRSIKREQLDRDYTDEYWEKRYTIRENLIPPQLEAVKDKVLLAGKYLNVVRECGGVDVSKVVEDVPLSFDDPRFLENVNSAYTYANSSLLSLLLTTHALPARLRSLKHYFFLDRSDFFSYFLELGASELKKPAKQVNTGKLQSLLDIVLRQPGSVAAEDPYKEDVKVAMNEIGLTNWLMKIVNVTGMDQDAAAAGGMNYLTPANAPVVTDDKEIIGFDALVLDYAMPFPLSLVVSRVTLTRYQLLFRYLLSLRHLETLLVDSWTDHSKVMSWKHRSSNPRIERWKRKAYTLRARMLIFVQQLLYYCTAEVIEPNWISLMSRLDTKSEDETQTSEVIDDNSPKHVKRTVDELMQDHVDFLATCLKECMLTNAKLLRINSKILSTCTMFANFTSHLSRYLVQADADLAAKPTNTPSAMTPGGTASAPGTIRSSHKQSLSGSAHPQHAFDPSRVDKMVDVLQKYEDNFSRHLKILLDYLNYLAATETVSFLSLCARLSTASEGSTTVGGAGGGGLGADL